MSAGSRSLFIAWISPSSIDSRSARAPALPHRVARLLELDLLDAVGGEDRDLQVAQVRPPWSLLRTWGLIATAALARSFDGVRPQRSDRKPPVGANRVATVSKRAGARELSMGRVNVTLPDGTELELADGATGADAAAAIGAGLARAALAVRQNGEVRDLARAARRRRAAGDRHRRSPTARWTSSATTPRTCSPPR